jgi:hypothetical protein
MKWVPRTVFDTKKSIKNVRKYCDSCQYKNFGTQWELSQCPKILIASETKKLVRTSGMKSSHVVCIDITSDAYNLRPFHTGDESIRSKYMPLKCLPIAFIHSDARQEFRAGRFAESLQ